MFEIKIYINFITFPVLVGMRGQKHFISILVILNGNCYLFKKLYYYEKLYFFGNFETYFCVVELTIYERYSSNLSLEQ